MTREDHILLGTIVKSHGISGDLVIRTKKHSFELSDNWESIFIEIDGLWVPFFVSEWQESKDDEFIITLDDIDSRDKADKLSGCDVYIRNCDIVIEPEPFSIHDFVDYTLYDSKFGKIGMILEVIDVPGNALLLVAYKNRKIHIPLQDELIKNIDDKKKTITLYIPEGLLDL